MKSQVIISTDPIADMLTRIRNAIAAGKHEIELPHSNIKQTVAKILADNGFVSGVRVSQAGGRKVLAITINSPDDTAKITEVARISRPGRRVYVKAKEIPVVKQGRGMTIISTSKGMMTGEQAVKSHLGGELICEVY